MSNNRNRGGPPKHRMGPNRESWTRVFGGEFVLYVQQPDDDNDLQDIKISFDGKPINLSNLTRQELDTLRTFFSRAFDLAEPVVDELDRRAAKAWEEGDDSYSRSYRAVSQLHVRKQRKPEHDSGLQGGPDESPEHGGGSD